MNSGKETLGSSGYEITVVIPKLDGFFRIEFGHRRDVARACLGDLILTPIGSSAIKLEAPDRETVDRFLEGFRCEDRGFNPTRDAYGKLARSTDNPRSKKFR